MAGCLMPEKQKNWELIYQQELKIARQNNDIESLRFFWPEYLKEREKNRANN